MIGLLMTGHLTVGIYCQWIKTADMGSKIMVIHFLDDVGKHSIGFAGSENGAIYRTSDRGKTWDPATVNKPFSGGCALDFAFKDSLRGWCGGTHGILETTDGGRNWFTRTIYPEVHSCYFNKHTKLLLVTHPRTNGKMSTDDGNTWVDILPKEMLGFAFSDGLHGISTTYFGLHYFTDDGGYTWQAASSGIESWQPAAITGTNSYLASSETFIGTNVIYRSNDNGSSWMPVVGFGGQSRMTGTIRGAGKTYYVQTDQGMQFSTDTAKSWHFICGPVNFYDTRFFTSGDTVFAGDYKGGLWTTYHGTSTSEESTLAIAPPPPYSLGVSECTELIHSFQVTIADNCEPSRVNIQNIQINGSNNFALLTPDTLPKLLPTNEFINIAYRPSTLLFDTASVTITYLQLGTLRDTTFTIYGSRISGGKKITITPPVIKKNIHTPCESLDTTIQIKANRCDTLELSFASLSNGSSFTSSLPFLPYYLPPDSTLTIRIQGFAEATGSFTDTLRLNLNSKDTSFSEHIPLLLSVKNSVPISAMYTPPRMSFGRVSICTTSTKPLKITNNTCTNITVNNISWATPSGDFSLPPTFTLPRTLIPGESDSLFILFAPQTTGSKQVSLRVTLERDSLKRDTIITVHAVGSSTMEAYFSDSIVSLGPILTCQTTVDTVYLSNASCEQIEINEINYDGTKGFTVLSPLRTTTIPPIDSVPVIISYASATGGTLDIPIEFRLRSKSGIETSAEIRAEAIMIERRDSVSILPKVIVFDSTSVCSDISDSFIAKNLSSCDSLLIISISLVGDPAFIIMSSPSVLLMPGDSIITPIYFSPASDGWHSTNITIHFKTRTREWDTVISVGGFGYGKKRLISSNITTIDLGEHGVCTELDTAITLRNDGCEDLTVSDAVLNGTGFTIDDIPTPIIIPAKSSHTFHLHSYIDTAGGNPFSSANIVFFSDAQNSLAPMTISRSYWYPVPISFTLDCDTSDDPFAPLLKIKVSDPSSLAKANVDKLTAKLIVNTDLLEIRKISGTNTYQMLGTSDIEIKGSPITCDNEGVIASVKYRSYLSDSTASQIILSGLRPSRGSFVLDSCSILLSSSGTFYQRPYECGDSMLIHSMRYMKPPISIESLQPNPASSQLKATITSLDKDVTINIRNLLGVVVLVKHYTIIDSEIISLDITSIPEGSYRVEVSNSVSSASKAFVVVR
jgi:photosystem II stability/assembly factor-like uncharacterized protein